MKVTLWRTGRHVGRTIYIQLGPEPSHDDLLIGTMDTTALAELVVRAVNAELIAKAEARR
jgi:hypothetical protein